MTNTEAERLLFEYSIRRYEPAFKFEGGYWGSTWVYRDFYLQCMWTGWLLAKGSE